MGCYKGRSEDVVLTYGKEGDRSRDDNREVALNGGRCVTQEFQGGDGYKMSDDRGTNDVFATKRCRREGFLRNRFTLYDVQLRVENVSTLHTWYWLIVGCGRLDKEINSEVEGNMWFQIMSRDPTRVATKRWCCFRGESCNSGMTVKIWR